MTKDGDRQLSLDRKLAGEQTWFPRFVRWGLWLESGWPTGRSVETCPFGTASGQTRPNFLQKKNRAADRMEIAGKALTTLSRRVRQRVPVENPSSTHEKNGA
jgi:hypothetical protein